MTRLEAGDVACWVLKTAVPPEALAPGWTPGAVRVLDRCLRRSYRLGLMRPGAPCLLWVSGRHRPGVHALGDLAAFPRDAPGGPEVSVRLVLLREHVPRGELVPDPAFAGAEVVRMPAGSNPSWLSAGQLAALRGRLGAGWAHAGTALPGTMRGCVATGSGGERSAGS